MRPGPRRLLTLAFSAAALAAGWLVTGPSSQLPRLPTATFALEALVTSAPPRRGHPQGRPAAAAATATATVHSGDSLSQLAHRYYHHAAWWPRIWWANRAAIHNPNLVPAGAQLRIPAPRHPRWTTTRAALRAIPPPPPPPPPPAPAPQAPAAAGPVAQSAPAPSGPVSGGTYSYAALEQLWVSAGGPASAAAQMAQIAECESGGNPQAYNPSGASGLWQILGNPFPGNPMDPATNAAMAVAKYNAAGGTSPWVCQ